MIHTLVQLYQISWVKFAAVAAHGNWRGLSGAHCGIVVVRKFTAEFKEYMQLPFLSSP